ncbi:hypothetical protein ACOSQ3_017227 [Xanthoceras sorbifolium]
MTIDISPDVGIMQMKTKMSFTYRIAGEQGRSCRGAGAQGLVAQGLSAQRLSAQGSRRWVQGLCDLGCCGVREQGWRGAAMRGRKKK